MNIAIIHYSLKLGGVSHLIKSQTAALKKNHKVKLISGFIPKDYPKQGCTVAINKKLDYLPLKITKEEAKDHYKSIKKFLLKEIHRKSIIHIHNPTLGKNPILTLVIYEMAQQGYKIVYNCHDFAEDNRSANLNFLKKILTKYFDYNIYNVMYPNLKNVSYATLNSKDIKWIKQQKIDNKKITVLHNPIIATKQKNKINRRQLCKKLKINTKKQLIIYPVRPIKRKNIGELILLGALLGNYANFIITLEPKNPIEKKLYLEWKFFSQKHQINIAFDASKKVGYENLINNCDKVITTSIQEGFGYAFLEPWLLGKPVVGRCIEYIMNDLKKEGLKFSSLYNNLLVDLWFSKKDFGALSEKQKQKIIKKALKNNAFAKKIIKENNLQNKIINNGYSQLIKNNNKIIQAKYSLEKYGEKLIKIYKKLS